MGIYLKLECYLLFRRHFCQTVLLLFALRENYQRVVIEPIMEHRGSNPQPSNHKTTDAIDYIVAYLQTQFS